MDIITAQNTFAVRLYEWSQRDFLRELQEGCPLLSTVGLNNRRLAAFVMWNETLSSNERKELVIALTRYCHENAARLRGDTETEQERAWRNALYEHTNHGYQQEHVPPTPGSDKTSPDFRPVNPDHCLDHLATCLAPIMGKPSRRKSKVLCTHKVGDWKIVTEFTFDRKNERLYFEYHFTRKDGGPAEHPHPAQGPFPRMLLYFYGLGDDGVHVPSDDDSEPMAKVMANLAQYFVAQADPRFEGLGIND